MASLNYQDVIELSHDDVKESRLLTLETLGFPATSWQPFSQALTHVELSAEFTVEASKIAVFLKEAFLLETSRGEALTRLARSEYGKERNAAVETQLRVILTCDANNGPHPIDVGEITITHTQSGSTYRNVASDSNSISYPGTLLTSASVNLLFESEVAGTLANIADLVHIEDSELVIDTSLAGVTITAYALERSGLEEESDDRLIERCQLAWARNLPKLGLIDDGVKASAYEAAPAVTTVAVDSTNPRGQGTFDVHIAGLDATASAQDVSLVQIALDLQTFGRNNTPKTCQVYAAPEVTLDISGIVYFTGTAAATVQTAVEAYLLAFIRLIPCGGLSYTPGPQHTIQKNDIESVIRVAVASVASARTTVILSTPSGDTSVSTYGKVVRGTWNLTYSLMNA